MVMLGTQVSWWPDRWVADIALLRDVRSKSQEYTWPSMGRALFGGCELRVCRSARNAHEVERATRMIHSKRALQCGTVDNPSAGGERSMLEAAPGEG